LVTFISRTAARTFIGIVGFAVLVAASQTTPSPRLVAQDAIEHIAESPLPAQGQPADRADAGRAASPFEVVHLPADASQDWWSTVQKNIAASEYHVTWHDKTPLSDVPAAFQAANRAQGFRTYFTKSGIRVVPRTGEQPSWQWGLDLLGYGWAGDVRPVEAVEPRAEANRVDYERSGLTEWYVNDPKGLEQGFTLDRPLDASESADTSKVVIELALCGGLGAHPSDDGQSIEFAHGNVRVLRYAELKVTDATVATLPAHIEVTSRTSEGARVRIVVDVATALWPITVDPLATAAIWIAEGNQMDAGFGYSVASAGDVNGDGYADVIVGAYQYSNGEACEGRAFVYYGSSLGLSTDPNWTAEGNQAHADFGWSVASAGDVNGDGYSDVIVGACQYSTDWASKEGRVYVYHGSASGLSTTAAWTAESNQPSALLGSAVASAGDVNDDGYADIIVGAPRYANGEEAEGRAYVYYGSARGVNAGVAGTPFNAAWTAEGDQVKAYFGFSVASAGDVNGDGYADVIVGAYRFESGQAKEGRAFVYHGSASGLSAIAAWTAEGDKVDAEFGYSVASAGDVNGDGYGDVIVGSHMGDFEAKTGGAFVYHGSANGVNGGVAGTPTNAAWVSESELPGGTSGDSVAAAGDVNGDGYSDVIVGAPHWVTFPQLWGGRVFIYFGSASGLSADANWSAVGDLPQDTYFGSSVASAGDVNGDGYADIIVGAHGWANGEAYEGRAFVFHGHATGLSTTTAWTGESEKEGGWFGYSVASAGDVNGDGYADVIVGAPWYSNDQAWEGRAFVYCGSASGLATAPAWTAERDYGNAHFGFSVASAGDVNGDGYGDVIVGAFDYTNGQTGEGQAFVYCGSASGPATAPTWTAESDQVEARLGTSVAAAGDVNGDGYGDVIVGAACYHEVDSNQGRAFVWLGSASGVNGGVAGTPANAAWSAGGDQDVYGSCGCSVASAGDVNGDGYADVIVGAPRYTNGQSEEGQARVYHGSASGLSTTANWSAEGDQAYADFGEAVASAGDVNGDGYADVIVGAGYYTNGQEHEGRVYVYYGSASGLSTIANWSAEGDQPYADFGKSVASAGDINGDGYSDIVVGARGFGHDLSDEGRAYVFHGSASGLAATAAWIADGDQSSAWFGVSVASAGDVNGDGFADVIVGANYYDDGPRDEGWAFVYYGNGATGRPVLAEQFQGDGSSILQQPWGSAGGGDEFQVRAWHSSPFGRERVKEEIEGCPSGVPFGHESCVNSISAAWADSTASAEGVSLTETLSGLTANTLYRWRERTLRAPYTVTETGITPPPKPAHGPWRRLGAQAVEANIRTGDLLRGGVRTRIPRRH